jgi:hypothetical protein
MQIREKDFSQFILTSALEIQSKIEMIKKMLEDNKDIKEIMKYTGFTKEKILEIKNENN